MDDRAMSKLVRFLLPCRATDSCLVNTQNAVRSET